LINWGDYQNMPDYREGWQDPHQSGVARMGRALDPTTYIPGLNQISNPIHSMAESTADASNAALSPVMKGLDKFTETTTPGLKQLRSSVPGMEGITNFVNNKPVDAAAIAAASFFSGGAAAKAFPALGGAGVGTSAAGAPLGEAGTAAATNALTPAAFTTGGSAFAAPVSPLMSAGTTAGMNALTPAGYTAGASALSAPIQGAGLLGTTGTQAGLAALTPSFMGQGASGGVLEAIKPYAQKAMQVKDQYSTLKNYGMPDQDRAMNDRMQTDLAERIKNDDPNDRIPKPQDAIARKKRIIDAMMQQQKFFGGAF